MCWYCHWGWAVPVLEIYREAVRRLDGDDGPLHFGPSHIVWDDENFELAEDCLEHFDEWRGERTDAELVVVRWSLEELAKLPLDVRCPAPKEYEETENADPALFPPKVAVERP